MPVRPRFAILVVSILFGLQLYVEVSARLTSNATAIRTVHYELSVARNGEPLPILQLDGQNTSRQQCILLLPPNSVAISIENLRYDTISTQQADNSSSLILPTTPLRLEVSGRMGGYSVATFGISPLISGSTGQAQIEIGTISFDLGVVPSDQPASRISGHGSDSHFIRDRCVGYVGLIAEYDNLGVLMPEPLYRGAPTPHQGYVGSSVPFVIITSRYLASSFSEYAKYKSLQGFNALVVDLDWIAENFAFGSTIQTNIREFIRYAYEQWDTRWVLLGGDHDVIPPQKLWSMKEDGDHILSDYYYACLDGNWNLSGDAFIGEVADSVDVFPEVFVGRIPVETSSEVLAYFSKLVEYETATQYNTYQDHALFLGGYIGFKGDSRYIIDTFATYTPSNMTDRIFLEYIGETPIAYTKQDFIDSFNLGNSLFFAYTHSAGYDDIFLRKDDNPVQFTNEDAAALQNQGMYPVVAMVGCNVNRIDRECLSKALINNPSGGAIGFIGSPALDAGFASFQYMYDFFELAYQSPPMTIGEVSTLSHLANAGFPSQYDGYGRQTLLSYLYLGDPTVYLWSSTPQEFQVSHPVSVSKGRKSITIVVTDGTSPVEGASVTLRYGELLTATHITDASGSTTIEIDADREIPIEIGVHKRNFWFKRDTVQVADSRSLIFVSQDMFVEDSTELSEGNGNGLLEPNEVVSFSFVLENTGTADIPAVNCILRSSNPSVTILDSTYNAGSIASDASVQTAYAFRFALGESLQDLAIMDGIELHVDIGDTVIIHQILASVSVPLLELGTIIIDDDDVGNSIGNSNGALDVAEFIELPISITNRGRGTLEDLNAQLVPLDPTQVVFAAGPPYGVDNISYGDIPGLSTANAVEPFQFYYLGSSDTAEFTLILTDFYGNVSTFPLIVTGNLVSPSNIRCEVAETSISLTWDCPNCSSITAFNVYRRTASAQYTKSNYAPISGDMSFTDIDLAPGTEYFYQIVTISSNLVEGPASDEFHSATSPAQEFPWPINRTATNFTPLVAPLSDTSQSKSIMFCTDDAIYWYSHSGLPMHFSPGGLFQTGSSGASFAFSTLSAEDVDSDGAADIFLASNGSDGLLYGFANSESSSGGTPLSGWPVSLPAGNDVFYSPVTLADVDHDGEYEIFTCTRQGSVCAVNSDGTPFIGASIDFYTIPNTWTYSAVAIGDVTSDGVLNLVVTTAARELYVFDLNGNVVAGFPVSLGDYSFPSSPVLANFDDTDVGLEICVNVGMRDIYLIDGDGSVLLSWSGDTLGTSQLFYSVATPAPIDINNDGILEIVSVVNDKLLVIDQGGIVQPGWPKDIYDISQTGISNSPLVGEISGDGIQDIVLSLDDGRVHSYSGDGTITPGFPKAPKHPLNSIPVISDMTGSTDAYIIKADGKLSAWNNSSIYVPSSMLWPVYQHDSHRTGNICGTKPTLQSLSAPVSICIGGNATFSAVASDPDVQWGDELTYSWSASVGTIAGNGAQATYTAPSGTETAIIDLVVFDRAGNSIKETRTIPITGCGPGSSCPFLFVNTADGFKEDNTILTQSENIVNKGLSVTDYYLMEVAPEVQNGAIQLEIRELEMERSYIDNMELLVVDVPIGHELAFTSSGKYSVTAPSDNLKYSVMSNGQDVTELVQAFDAEFLFGLGPIEISVELPKDIQASDSIVIEAALLAGPGGGGGIKDLHKALSSAGSYDSFTPLKLAMTDNGYTIIESIEAPRANGSRVSFKIPAPQSTTINLKLEWETNIAIDRIRVSLCPTIDVEIQRIGISNASLDGEQATLKNVQLVDEQFVMLFPGHTLALTFEGIQPPAEGYYQEYVLVSTGYYTSFNDQGDSRLLPDNPELLQNYPNPFNPVTIIPYSLPKSGHVRIDVFNLLGQTVRTLVDEDIKAGYNAVEWNGTNASGTPVASGVYLIRMQASGSTFTKSMQLLK